MPQLNYITRFISSLLNSILKTINSLINPIVNFVLHSYSTTSLTFSGNPQEFTNVDVYRNGVRLEAGRDYRLGVSVATLNFNEPISSGEQITLCYQWTAEEDEVPTLERLTQTVSQPTEEQIRIKEEMKDVKILDNQIDRIIEYIGDIIVETPEIKEEKTGENIIKDMFGEDLRDKEIERLKNELIIKENIISQLNEDMRLRQHTFEVEKLRLQLDESEKRVELMKDNLNIVFKNPVMKKTIMENSHNTNNEYHPGGSTLNGVYVPASTITKSISNTNTVNEEQEVF